MRKISPKEFIKNIKKDPAWCLSVVEPIEITGYVNAKRSKITHLSPLLHFKSDNQENISANFSGCDSLKEASGNFYGSLTFSFSSIETTKDLKVFGEDEKRWIANFIECKNLKILEGEFSGAVIIGDWIEEVNATIKNSKEDIKIFVTSFHSLKPHWKYLTKEYLVEKEGTLTEFTKKCEIEKVRAEISRFPKTYIL